MGALGSVDGTAPLELGYLVSGASQYFDGWISNFQLYNTSLDAGQVQSLYAEGIGGAPIVRSILLDGGRSNGNSNDYSGNNNNGAATSVTYPSSWMSGYQGH